MEFVAWVIFIGFGASLKKYVPERYQYDYGFIVGNISFALYIKWINW